MTREGRRQLRAGAQEARRARGVKNACHKCHRKHAVVTLRQGALALHICRFCGTSRFQLPGAS